MSDAYDVPLRTLMRRTAAEIGLDRVHEGVYLCQSGPCFETVAECRMMRVLGADTAGIWPPKFMLITKGQQAPVPANTTELLTWKLTFVAA